MQREIPTCFPFVYICSAVTIHLRGVKGLTRLTIPATIANAEDGSVVQHCHFSFLGILQAEIVIKPLSTCGIVYIIEVIPSPAC